MSQAEDECTGDAAKGALPTAVLDILETADNQTCVGSQLWNELTQRDPHLLRTLRRYYGGVISSMEFLRPNPQLIGQLPDLRLPEEVANAFIIGPPPQQHEL
ncbi:unnamed protein product [Amoebophrya sp. A25]|nr:unnamed protein product [Amoebophrya sp. A25]|eukprot:GSA25T00020157001.1